MRTKKEMIADLKTILKEFEMKGDSRDVNRAYGKLYLVFAEYLLDIRDILDNIGDALATTVTRIHGEEE